MFCPWQRGVKCREALCFTSVRVMGNESDDVNTSMRNIKLNCSCPVPLNIKQPPPICVVTGLFYRWMESLIQALKGLAGKKRWPEKARNMMSKCQHIFENPHSKLQRTPPSINDLQVFRNKEFCDATRRSQSGPLNTALQYIIFSQH